MLMFTLDQFCCICIEKYSCLEDINDTDKNCTTYKNKLLLCVPNQKWEEVLKLCKSCIEKLDSTYEFVQTCLRSERLRQEMVESVKKTGDAEDSKHLLQCFTCNKFFKSKRSLKLHITRLHSNHKSEKEVIPDLDNIDSKECLPTVLKDHVDKTYVKTENVDDLSKFRTDDDENGNDDIFKQDLDYSDHIDSSTEEEIQVKQNVKKRLNRRKNPLTCEYCGKVFYRRQHYTAHIRAKHTFEKPYECDLCDAKYSNSHSLLVHKRNHNNEKPFVCSYCGKSFVCSGDLYHHSKIHMNKREYKCNVCDKSFNTASILRAHRICMHTAPEDWKYVCSYCSKRFPIRSNLTNHIKRHVGLREVCCHICDKKFFDKSELTKHYRSHSSERLFKCDICNDKEYKNLYALKKHMKLIHGVGNIKIAKPEKKFSCTLCPKVFTFNNKLKKHMCTHTGEKPFKCQVCDKGFIDNYYRKVHLKKKHNVDVTDDGL